MAEAYIDQELKQLREDMAQVRADFERLMKKLLEAGATPEAEVEAPRDRLREAAHLLASAGSAGSQTAESLEACVRKHPLLSTLASLGLGFFLGRLLGSNRR